jgi:hypothetical protein
MIVYFFCYAIKNFMSIPNKWVETLLIPIYNGYSEITIIFKANKYI